MFEVIQQVNSKTGNGRSPKFQSWTTTTSPPHISVWGFGPQGVTRCPRAGTVSLRFCAAFGHMVVTVEINNDNVSDHLIRHSPGFLYSVENILMYFLAMIYALICRHFHGTRYCNILLHPTVVSFMLLSVQTLSPHLTPNY